MNSRTLCALIATATLSGCAPDDPTVPPEIVYGDSVCVFCNMIISDERFACAAIALDERERPAPRLFDDFNCMAMDEASRSDEILARWVHDHDTSQWTRAETATFVDASSLRTPMASGIAAFASHDRAIDAAQRWGGSTLDFTGAWSALAPGDDDAREHTP